MRLLGGYPNGAEWDVIFDEVDKYGKAMSVLINQPPPNVTGIIIYIIFQCFFSPFITTFPVPDLSQGYKNACSAFNGSFMVS
jgi:hypothetical protein